MTPESDFHVVAVAEDVASRTFTVGYNPLNIEATTLRLTAPERGVLTRRIWTMCPQSADNEADNVLTWLNDCSPDEHATLNPKPGARMALRDTEEVASQREASNTEPPMRGLSSAERLETPKQFARTVTLREPVRGRLDERTLLACSTILSIVKAALSVR
jgi:hypothetical protein